MRIAHISDFYLPRLGGIEVHVADLAQRQRAIGHDVHVVTSTPGEATMQVRRSGAGLAWGHPLNPRALSRGVRDAGRPVDVVHAHAGIGSPLAFLAARRAAQAGLPTVVTMHSVLDGYEGLFHSLDRLGGWSKLPIVWSAVSECAARPLRQALSGPSVAVLPNGIDQTAWQQQARRNPDTQVVTVAAVMRLTARKRPIPLLRIFAEARARLASTVDLRLVVAGEGPQLARMRTYLARHGLSAHVDLPGRLDRAQIHRLLAHADVFLAPANLESFGIAALEARCAGVPVLAKRTGGIGEFITDGHEGLLCDSDAAMTAALVTLAIEPATRQRIRTHNLATRCAVDWGVVTDLNQALYRQAQAAVAITKSHRATMKAGRR